MHDGRPRWELKSPIGEIEASGSTRAHASFSAAVPLTDSVAEIGQQAERCRREKVQVTSRSFSRETV